MSGSNLKPGAVARPDGGYACPVAGCDERVAAGYEIGDHIRESHGPADLGLEPLEVSAGD